jgi:hypothetical protein
MSMNCYALRLAETEVASVKRNPREAARLTQSATFASIGAGHEEMDFALPDLDRQWPGGPPKGGRDGRLWERLKRSLTGQLAGVKEAMAASRDVDRARLLDLHKSWHALHYLFTGEVEGGSPPANALLGGREFGEDMGYGPPRLHEPAATAAFARFLAPLTVAELQRRVDMGRMSALGIYCCEDDDEGSASELSDDIAHYFPLLQNFVADAAKNGDGLLVWLS